MWPYGCACVGRCCLLSPVGSGRTGLQSAHHFLFICPSTCVPMMPSQSVLSIPVLALKSPISMVMSFAPLLSNTACRCW